MFAEPPFIFHQTIGYRYFHSLCLRGAVKKEKCRRATSIESFPKGSPEGIYTTEMNKIFVMDGKT